MKSKKIALIGTWQNHKAAPYKEVLKEFGKFAADGGYEIVCGAGNGGIFPITLKEYKKHGGKKITVFLPPRALMKKIGEKEYPGGDKYIQIKEPFYAVRGIYLVKESDALMVFAGGFGSLLEIIYAYKDFHKPVYIYNSSKIKKVVPDCYDFLGGMKELRDYVKVFKTIPELSKLLK